VYRYPVFDERAAYQGYPLAEFVNLELEAEEGDNFELGFKYIGRNFECYFTSFILKLDNEIIYDPNAEGSTVYKGLNVNLGPVDRAGIDAAFIYRRESWGASSRMAWIDTEVRAGEGRGYEVPLVPPFRVTNQFWLEPVESLRIRFSHSYVASQYRGGDFTNSSSRVENYYLFGLGAELGVGPNGHVFLTVENLLDELYAGAVHGDNYYPGDGRSIVVGVKLNF
jgi:outer membrane receptor protein involved in Fe transport